MYVDSSSRFPHGSKRDIIEDAEVSVLSLFALLSALKQWCKLIKTGEWIYQVNYKFKNKSERKFTSDFVVTSGAPKRPGAR